MARNTKLGDYLPFLRRLGESRQSYFLEGGQSVNFWAVYFQDDGLADASLNDHKPFTSKDCDIWVSNPAFDFIKSSHGDLILAGNSPADGQLGILNLDGNPDLKIDLLSNVFGIPAKQIERVFKRTYEFDGVRVLDPIFLFQSKCHCLVSLNQACRQDRKHVEMLTLILPAYFHGLLNKVVIGEIRERQLIKEVKLFLRMEKDKWVRKALKEIGQGLESMVPIELFRNCGQTKLEAFVEQKWGSSSEL